MEKTHPWGESPSRPPSPWGHPGLDLVRSPPKLPNPSATQYVRLPLSTPETRFPTERGTGSTRIHAARPLPWVLWPHSSEVTAVLSSEGPLPQGAPVPRALLFSGEGGPRACSLPNSHSCRTVRGRGRGEGQAGKRPPRCPGSTAASAGPGTAPVACTPLASPMPVGPPGSSSPESRGDKVGLYQFILSRHSASATPFLGLQEASGKGH